MKHNIFYEHENFKKCSKLWLPLCTIYKYHVNNIKKYIRDNIKSKCSDIKLLRNPKALADDHRNS